MYMTTHRERLPAAGDGYPLGSAIAHSATPNWIAASGRWRQCMQEPSLTKLLDGLILVLGTWLTLVPAMWNYDIAGDGFDAPWNDVLVGIAVIIVGLTRTAHPVRSVAVSIASFMLGAWLVLAPLTLAYGFNSNSALAAINDIVVGAVIAVSFIFQHNAHRTAKITKKTGGECHVADKTVIAQ